MTFAYESQELKSTSLFFLIPSCCLYCWLQVGPCTFNILNSMRHSYTYFPRSLPYFPLVAPHLLTILEGLVVKHLATCCTTSASSCLVPTARLPLFAWSPRYRCWRRDPPEIQSITASPPPEPSYFLLLHQFPKMVHWLAVWTAVPAQKRGWHKALRWYPLSFVAPIS